MELKINIKNLLSIQYMHNILIILLINIAGHVSIKYINYASGNVSKSLSQTRPDI